MDLMWNFHDSNIFVTSQVLLYSRDRSLYILPPFRWNNSVCLFLNLFGTLCMLVMKDSLLKCKLNGVGCFNTYQL